MLHNANFKMAPTFFFFISNVLHQYSIQLNEVLMPVKLDEISIRDFRGGD